MEIKIIVEKAEFSAGLKIYKYHCAQQGKNMYGLPFGLLTYTDNPEEFFKESLEQIISIWNQSPQGKTQPK